MRVLLIFVALLSFVQFSHASVVITGTRVIYPADQREVNIQLSNTGDVPALVQAWVEPYTDPSAPVHDVKEQDIPFVLSPPVFRINPKEGQTIRLMYVGGDLPQDRESVFYFNVLDIPPAPSADKTDNFLQLAINSKLKLFYRPTAVSKNLSKLKDELRFSLIEANGYQLKVDNPTGNFFTLLDLKFYSADKSVAGPEIGMVDPKSSRTIAIPNNKAFISQATRLEVNYVDDYGAKRKITYNLD
ncbi:MAG TPA: molecular chaperone [Thiopseudomonas sp.]|nr:molecular chaperone [Thiopseudomonas sp.]